MKKILLFLSLFIALLGGFLTASGQNVNPEPNFSTQVLSFSPSLYLNFNDLTTNFLDQVSQDAFKNTASVVTYNNIGTLPTASAATTSGYVLFMATPLTAGGLSSFELQYYAAPTAGTLTIVIGNQSGSSITIASSFTVTVAATTAVQTFTSGVNYSPITVSAGQLIGFWTPTAQTAPGTAAGSGTNRYFYAAPSSLPVGAETYSSDSNRESITATVSATTTYTSGTVTPRQPGFDSTQVNNTSAEFPYNGFNAAPNETLGAIDWNVPWTMLFHVDRLNWNRSTPLVLVSKGDNSSIANSYWQLVLQMSGTDSQLCFEANAPLGTGISASGGICTNATNIDAMPNGYNYDIVISNSGTGVSGVGGSVNAFTMYINGLEVGGAGSFFPYTNVDTGGRSFGAVSYSVTGGTGYANSTLFTSTGGGPNCLVAGTMTSVSGVPTGLSNTSSTSPNYGCTSAPTLVLTSPTGTGAVLTATLIAPDTINSTTYPLMVPGYVNGAAFYGPGGTTTTQTSTYVDEFAIFPGVFTLAQIQNIYYQTKFYQRLLVSKPSIPPVVIFDDDGCGDSDSLSALELTIAAHRLGYVKLEGVDDSATVGSASLAIFRQMLDQAGLNNVPVSVPSVPLADSNCAASVASIYNASTPYLAASYESAATMYRTVLAANPARSVFILQGGGFRGVSDLMQSPADSISSLTGLQLLAQDATNGGAIYAEGPALEPCCGTGSSYVGVNPLVDWIAAQYVLENNGAMPIYWYGGTPTRGGPGILTSRTGKDPFYSYQMAAGYGDEYDTYDTLDTMPFLTSLFSGGVTIAISGSGTGYATDTPFTSTGGGANCVVTGIMVSVGGVPSSIIPTGGPYESAAGIGTGCLTASNPPTIVLTSPTGTGAVLTATVLASPCSTMTVTSATAGSTSTSTCTNNYFVPLSSYAFPIEPSLSTTPVMQWFINSLLDPPPNGTPRRQ